MGYCSVRRGWERCSQSLGGEGRGGGKLRCVVGGGREGTLSSACLPSSFEGSYGKW